MRTHRFEPASLVFGLLFTVIGFVFLNGDVEVWDIEWSWFWPVVLTVAGALVLLSARPGRDAADAAALSPSDDE